MIIRTNLCWPLLARERPGRTRWVVGAGLTVAAIVAATYWAVLGHLADLLAESVHTGEATLARKRVELAELQAKYERDLIHAARRDQTVKFARQRLNWAPLLERLFVAVRSNVELTSLSAECLGQDECRMRIAGVAAGPQPRIECDKARVLMVAALAGEATEVRADFERLEESPRMIQWEGESYPTAEFVITVSWKHLSNGS